MQKVLKKMKPKRDKIPAREADVDNVSKTKKTPPPPILTKPKVEKFRIDELEFADYNPRQISNAALVGLQDSLREFGMLEVPVVNVFENRKRLVSGHQRVTALRLERVEFVDCIVVEFDDVKERMANLAMNNQAIQGQYDVAAALPMLEEISRSMPKPDMACLKSLQEEIEQDAARMKRNMSIRDKTSRLADDHSPDASAIRKAKAATGPNTDQKLDNVSKIMSEHGKAYQLGVHRLFCGDFRKGTEKLFGNIKADACVTDPPYNVEYLKDVITNDKMSGDEWAQFIGDTCRFILKYSAGPSYVFMSIKELHSLALAWESNKGVVGRWLLWVKDEYTLGLAGWSAFRGTDYHHMCEQILYGYSKPCAMPKTPRTNVFEIAKPKLHNLHPTAKPLELIKLLVEDSCDEGGLIYEPFAGSGTTLIAAEELKRVAYCCEFEPMYCDVTRKRWAELVHGVGCDWISLTPEMT